MRVLHNDRHFRLFTGAQWLGGTSALALPFYVLLGNFSAADVAILLGAQTAGALLSNPLWGWWGDQLGKRSLLEGSAAVGAIAPMLALIWIASAERWGDVALPYFTLVFALLGAAIAGEQVSRFNIVLEFAAPEDQPTYIGLTNTLLAPVTVLAPLLGGWLATVFDFRVLFVSAIVLAGTGGALRDVVLLNSGAALLIAGRADTLEGGIELAARSLDSGAARRVLLELIARTNTVAEAEAAAQ